MQPLAVIAAILFLIFIQNDGQQITATSCGQRIPQAIPLMMNAYKANHFPWHAAIYHKGGNSAPQYKCGGTVIDSMSILTAAHCVSTDNIPMIATNIFVSLGKLNLDVTESSSQSFEADKIIVHENYSSIDFNNDIAIIRLAKKANFNNYVQPICLWNASKTEFSQVIGSHGTVIGWGRTESAEKSDVLREASMPVVDPVGCLISNRNFIGSILSKTNFCAGSRNGTSICEGDSGGSMTFELNGLFHIRGIVSVTANIHNETTQQFVCDATQFAIFTDVAQYLLWINNHMSECVEMVRCVEGRFGICGISLHINHTDRRCKIMFADVTYTHVTSLHISGQFAELPDVINEFEKLGELSFHGAQLEIVDRAKLATFKRIQSLDLAFNEITALAADTFADLKDLEILRLSFNKLKTLHRDVFKELHNLTLIDLDTNQIEILPDGLFQNNQKLKDISLSSNKIQVLHRDVFQKLHDLVDISLFGNQLEVLPEGLFRDNQKLRRIGLTGNKIRKIEFNFYSLPKLKRLLLKKNVCIDQWCMTWSICGTKILTQISSKC